MALPPLKESLYADPVATKLCIYCGGTSYNEPCDTHFFTVEEELRSQIQELESRIDQLENKRNKSRPEIKPIKFKRKGYQWDQ